VLKFRVTTRVNKNNPSSLILINLEFEFEKILVKNGEGILGIKRA
jgi:hypothetical protein